MKNKLILYSQDVDIVGILKGTVTDIFAGEYYLNSHSYLFLHLLDRLKSVNFPNIKSLSDFYYNDKLNNHRLKGGGFFSG
jgi:hypothetical protein